MTEPEPDPEPQSEPAGPRAQTRTERLGAATSVHEFGQNEERAAMRAPTGLIVGRFDPPHLGHSHMIDWAAARVDRLVVFVNSRSTDAAPGSLRAGWLADLHPDVDVVEVGHDLDTDFGDPELWQKWMALFRSRWPHGDGPHVVFSSDHYVSELADRFGAEAVVVDAERQTVPVSSTMIRTDPAAHVDRLAPDVRAWVEANWC